MQVTMQYENGTRSQALLLSAGKDRMRVVIPGKPDTEEWTRSDGRWRDGDGRLMEFEAFVLLAGIDVSGLCEAFPLTAAAGRFDN